MTLKFSEYSKTKKIGANDKNVWMDLLTELDKLLNKCCKEDVHKLVQEALQEKEDCQILALVSKSVASHLCIPSVAPSDVLIDLGADSLDPFEIIMELEKEFEIEIPYVHFSDQIQNTLTVQDLCNIVKKYLN